MRFQLDGIDVFQVVPAKRRRVVGLPNYAPAPPAEGEVVMQRKINELRHAETAAELKQLLEETFPGRRDAIIKGKTMREILADFPQLFLDGGVRLMDLGIWGSAVNSQAVPDRHHNSC